MILEARRLDEDKTKKHKKSDFEENQSLFCSKQKHYIMSKRIQTADDYINKGNSLFVDEQYEEALAVYSEAIDLEADNAEAFLKRSACHYALKNFAGTKNLKCHKNNI